MRKILTHISLSIFAAMALPLVASCEDVSPTQIDDFERARFEVDHWRILVSDGALATETWGTAGSGAEPEVGMRVQRRLWAHSGLELGWIGGGVGIPENGTGYDYNEIFVGYWNEAPPRLYSGVIGDVIQFGLPNTRYGTMTGGEFDQAASARGVVGRAGINVSVAPRLGSHPDDLTRLLPMLNFDLGYQAMYSPLKDAHGDPFTLNGKRVSAWALSGIYYRFGLSWTF